MSIRDGKLAGEAAELVRDIEYQLLFSQENAGITKLDRFGVDGSGFQAGRSSSYGFVAGCRASGQNLEFPGEAAMANVHFIS
jgi:hypothetical protein